MFIPIRSWLMNPSRKRRVNLTESMQEVITSEAFEAEWIVCSDQVVTSFLPCGGGVISPAGYRALWASESSELWCPVR